MKKPRLCSIFIRLGLLVCILNTFGTHTMEPEIPGLSRCLAHITKVPEIDATHISGFHFYPQQECESVRMRIPGNATLINVDRMRQQPDTLWVYKVATNEHGDCAGYVINNGLAWGPRTFFGSHETNESLQSRLITSPLQFTDVSGIAFRLFDGPSIQESTIARVHDCETGQLITAYPPLESFNFDETRAARIAHTLAQQQMVRLQKHVLWNALSEENLTDFKHHLVRCTDAQQQQDLLDAAATQNKWDFVEALVQRNPENAPRALWQTIKHLDQSTVERFSRFVEDKDAPLVPDGPTPLITACTATGDPEKRCATMQQLLDEGASIDSQNAKGRTPLMYAARAGDTLTVEFLVHRGANITLRDHERKSAEDFAIDTQTWLQRHNSATNTLDLIQETIACLHSPTREHAPKGKKLSKNKEKKSPTHAGRSSPENKLVTLNTLLAQEPEQALERALELVNTRLARVEIQDTKDLKNQRITALKNLMLHIDPAQDRQCKQWGTLCNALSKKDLLRIADIIALCAPDAEAPAPLASTCALIDALEFPVSSDNWKHADRLLQKYKDPQLIRKIVEKCDLSTQRFHEKTLMCAALERGNPEEISALFVALEEKITDAELTYALNKNYGPVLVKALVRQHPDWSPFTCMLQLGPDAVEFMPEIHAAHEKQSQHTIVLLVKNAVLDKNFRMFRALQKLGHSVFEATDDEGNNALMCVLTTNESLTDNKLFKELVQHSDLLHSNAARHTACDIAQINQSPAARFLVEAQENYYHEIARSIEKDDLSTEEQAALDHLLNAPAFDPLWKLSNGRTLLTHAVACKNTRVTHILLTKISRLNTEPICLLSEPTPLCFAWIAHDEVLCAQLLERGAQWNEIPRYIFSCTTNVPFVDHLFFSLLDNVDATILQSLPERERNNIRLAILFYATANNKPTPASRILTYGEPLFINFDLYCLLFQYALIHQYDHGSTNDDMVRMLLNEHIHLNLDKNVSDPVYKLAQKLTDSPFYNRDEIKKIAQETSVTPTEAFFIHALSYFYKHSSKRACISHIIQLFPTFWVKDQSTYQFLLSLSLSYKDFELTRFLARNGATTLDPIVELIVAIVSADPERVQHVLEHHHELRASICHSSSAAAEGQQTIPPLLIEAFLTHQKHVEDGGTGDTVQKSFDVFVHLFSQCNNVLELMHVSAHDSEQQPTDKSLLPFSFLCRLEHELTPEEITRLMSPININTHLDLPTEVMTYTSRIFITTLCLEDAFGATYQKSAISRFIVKNSLNILDWICDNQHVSNIRLNDEHLTKLCETLQQFISNQRYKEAYGELIRNHQYKNIVRKIYTMVEQRPDIRTNPATYFLQSYFKK